MSHPNSADRADSKRRVPLMATVLVGIGALIAGAVLGGAALLGFGATSDSLEDADSKAEAGCAMVERLTEDYTDQSDFGPLGEDPVWNEVGAATSLMMAAGDMDPAYEELRESVSTVVPQEMDPEQEQGFIFDDAVAVCDGL